MSQEWICLCQYQKVKEEEMNFYISPVALVIKLVDGNTTDSLEFRVDLICRSQSLNDALLRTRSIDVPAGQKRCFQ